MKKIKLAVLGLFLYGSLFLPFYSVQKVEAFTDELSNTFWYIQRTDLALEFDDRNRVTLLKQRARGGGYDRIGTGTYKVRRNIVTFYFEGRSTTATISGRNRNIMTGRFYVDRQVYVIRAVRED